MPAPVHANLLINDSQLGDSLNQAVHQGRRGDFGLLLAMLSDDARDLPRIEEPAAETGEPDWRAHFALPEPTPPLFADGVDHIRAAGLSRLAGELQQDSLRLLLAMRGEPLKPSRNELPAEVASNLAPRTLARMQGQLNAYLPQQPERMLDVLEAVHATA
ncbi:VC2046/SO_2500 family protein [Oceanimonas sp. CHS3-5]|uniref:VC2046/SO_2500 family protein n=1 Tax=Oceanimonas sp. CHS3-5 TaxID=3068186 RepID=UPI00273FAEEA|nr:VC2046/SO_2500 family protein [Oceanimonas sp. CHS3-5]MDP5292311.1 VC2046/SO_2500 family protein [Oceanimonas sp. CHS3-5]